MFFLVVLGEGVVGNWRPAAVWSSDFVLGRSRTHWFYLRSVKAAFNFQILIRINEAFSKRLFHHRLRRWKTNLCSVPPCRPAFSELWRFQLRSLFWCRASELQPLFIKHFQQLHLSTGGVKPPASECHCWDGTASVIQSCCCGSHWSSFSISFYAI